MKLKRDKEQLFPYNQVAAGNRGKKKQNTSSPTPAHLIRKSQWVVGRVGWDLPMELKHLWNLRLFRQLSVLVKVVINLVKQTKEKWNFYLIIIPDLGGPGDQSKHKT